ncbi:MAG: hypothetical protein V4596_11085 [Bdellovibrionota bacterium]
MFCFKCQTEILTIPGVPVGRREDCPSCGSDVHVCMNCTHYDRSAYNECKESSSDYVKEKDRSNFCDYFTPSDRKGSSGKSKDDLMSAAEALFKKK